MGKDGFKPNRDEPTGGLEKTRTRCDPAKLKYAEILYYEGRTVKEVASVTGLPIHVLNYHVYYAKDAWQHVKRDVAELRKSNSLQAIIDASNNYSRILLKSSEDLARKVEEGEVELKLQDQKIVSEIISSQIKNTAIVRADPSMPQTQTNIQINLSKDEADNVLENDPAKGKDPMEIPTIKPENYERDQETKDEP